MKVKKIDDLEALHNEVRFDRMLCFDVETGLADKTENKARKYKPVQFVSFYQEGWDSVRYMAHPDLEKLQTFLNHTPATLLGHNLIYDFSCIFPEGNMSEKIVFHDTFLLSKVLHLEQYKYLEGVRGKTKKKEDYRPSHALDAVLDEIAYYSAMKTRYHEYLAKHYRVMLYVLEKMKKDNAKPTKEQRDLEKACSAYEKLKHKALKDYYRKTVRWADTIRLDMISYACGDVYFLPYVLTHFEKRIKNTSYKLDRAVVKVLVDMRAKGMPIDRDSAEKEEKQARETHTQITREIGFNIASPKQVKEALKKHGYPYESTNEERLKIYCTLKDTPDDIKELVSKILTARGALKHSSVLEKSLIHNIKNERVAGYYSLKTVTGRTASDEPNMQNLARKSRHIFKAKDGSNTTLIAGDFPQLEIYGAACLGYASQTLELLKTQDIHSYTASAFYGIPYTEITKESHERSIAKACNFALLYGMGFYGLYTKFIKDGIADKNGKPYTQEFVHFLHKKWGDTHRELKIWQNWTKRAYYENPAFTNKTALGRIYRGGSVQDQLNYQVQGSCAEVFKLALKVMYDELHTCVPDAHIVACVHDNYIVECKNDDIPQVARIMLETMQKSFTTVFKEYVQDAIYLPLEIKAGNSLGDIESKHNIRHTLKQNTKGEIT